MADNARYVKLEGEMTPHRELLLLAVLALVLAAATAAMIYAAVVGSVEGVLLAWLAALGVGYFLRRQAARL